MAELRLEVLFKADHSGESVVEIEWGRARCRGCLLDTPLSSVWVGNPPHAQL
jgi:hypothetical protein